MEKYEKISRIGQGSYGRVYVVREISSKRDFVMKRIRISDLGVKDINLALQEAQILNKLKHPNIVGYHDSFYNGKKQEICIIMDYCQEGDVKSFIKKEKGFIKESLILNWFLQIMLALDFIHSRKILHRDLKTQNIFLTKNLTVKIGDFGISRILKSKSDMAETVVGTPLYMSPEQLEKKPYSFESDIWALGCCLYEIASKRVAFQAKNINDLVFKVRNKRPLSLPSIYSADFRRCVFAMLSHDATVRPTIREMTNYSFLRKEMENFVEKSGEQAESVDKPRNNSHTQDSNQPSKQRLEKPKLPHVPLITAEDVALKHQRKADGKKTSPHLEKIEKEYLEIRKKHLASINQEEQKVQNLKTTLDNWKTESKERRRTKSLNGSNVREKLKQFRMERLRNDWKPKITPNSQARLIRAKSEMNIRVHPSKEDIAYFEYENEVTEDKKISSTLMVENIRLKKLTDSLKFIDGEVSKLKDATELNDIVDIYTKKLGSKENEDAKQKTPAKIEDGFEQANELKEEENEEIDEDEFLNIGVTQDRVSFIKRKCALVIGEESLKKILAARRQNALTREQISKFLHSKEGTTELRQCLEDIETLLLLEDNLY